MSERSTGGCSLPEQFQLARRTALVTGGTGYLGQVFCATLAQAGASVIVASRDQDRAEGVAAQLMAGDQQEHLAVELDYERDESIERGFHHARALTGAVDILINNGHILESRDWRALDAVGFQSQMRNATGYFTLSRLTRDAAVQQSRPASIVMLGSMYGQVASYPDVYAGLGPASSVAYQCLKGGIAQMARHLAVYWAKDRVRVNTLSPGPFPNPETAPRELIDRLEAKSPMARIGLAAELGPPLLFLCSDASSYVTGHNLIVDGGWTAW